MKGNSFELKNTLIDSDNVRQQDCMWLVNLMTKSRGLYFTELCFSQAELIWDKSSAVPN